METGETATPVARRWGYEVKGIPTKRVSWYCRATFGAAPWPPSPPYHSVGVQPLWPFSASMRCPPDDLNTPEAALAESRVCAFMAEPIKGEAGIVVPSSDYLPAAGARACPDRAYDF